MPQRVLLLPKSFGYKKTRTNLAKVDRATSIGASKLRVIELLKSLPISLNEIFREAEDCESMKLLKLYSLAH